MIRSVRIEKNNGKHRTYGFIQYFRPVRTCPQQLPSSNVSYPNHPSREFSVKGYENKRRGWRRWGKRGRGRGKWLQTRHFLVEIRKKKKQCREGNRITYAQHLFWTGSAKTSVSRPLIAPPSCIDIRETGRGGEHERARTTTSSVRSERKSLSDNAGEPLNRNRKKLTSYRHNHVCHRTPRTDIT